MPGWMTYNSLLTDLGNYFERGSGVQDPIITEQLPRIVQMAQAKIIQDLKIQGQQSVVAGLMSTGVPVYPKPDRWRETISMRLGLSGTQLGIQNAERVTESQLPRLTELGGVRVPIITSSSGISLGGAVAITNPIAMVYPRVREYCDLYWPDRTKKGQPRYYADYDRYHWLIIPTPDFDYELEITFYQKTLELSSDVQENWLTQEVPNLLLYACLSEEAPFLREDERYSLWKSRYDEIKASLTAEDVEKVVDRTNQRTRA